MTPLDVIFRYVRTPGPLELQAINNMRAVYGIRRVQFYENDHTIRVELDASRLTEAEVATLLRYAGVELKGKMELVR
jgi:hypothetical protein